MVFFEIQFPFEEPVIIITLVLVILLIGPAFFERVRIPSIVGLLISGAVIGPHGFNLVSPDLEFSLLGTMGLLYLMFLAGFEINLIDFIPKAPEGMESNWRETVPGKGWFVLLRLYGPLDPWFDKTWQPGEFEMIN